MGLSNRALPTADPRHLMVPQGEVMGGMESELTYAQRWAYAWMVCAAGLAAALIVVLIRTEIAVQDCAEAGLAWTPKADACFNPADAVQVRGLYGRQAR